MPFSGSIPALITPFADGRIDDAAFHRLVCRQIENGSSGVVVGGSTGESVTLADDELERLVHVACEAAAGRVPVIAGTGSNATAHAIALTQRVERAGASATLHATGYYNRPNAREVLAHYQAIASAARRPVLVYDIPARTGLTLSLETLVQLAGMAGIAGIKDSTGDLGRLSLQRRRLPDGFSFLSGDDASCLGYLAHGGDGCISVTANAAPELCARLVAAARRGDLVEARALHDRLMPLHAALFLEPSPAGIKYAMSRLGLANETLRAPLLPVEAATRAAIDEALAMAGLV